MEQRDVFAGLSDTAAGAAKKARTSLDDDCEISAVETPSTPSESGHGPELCTHDAAPGRPVKLGSESEAAVWASELKSLQEKRLYAEVYGDDVDHKVISGKWVLKNREMSRRKHGACYVAARKTCWTKTFPRVPR